jgi:hypothetical protein
MTMMMTSRIEGEREERKKFTYVSLLSLTHPRLFLRSIRSLLMALLSWAATRAAKLAGPSAPGSKEVPEGVPDCLLGLSFVFTGEFSAFSREEAIDIANRYGGYVVSLAYNTFTALTRTPPYLPAHPTHPQPRRRPTLLQNRLRHPRRGRRPLQARCHQETRSHHSKRGRVSQPDRYEEGTGQEERQRWMRRLGRRWRRRGGRLRRVRRRWRGRRGRRGRGKRMWLLEGKSTALTS